MVMDVKKKHKQKTPISFYRYWGFQVVIITIIYVTTPYFYTPYLLQLIIFKYNCGFESLLVLHDLEFYLISFGKGSKPFTLDRSLMYKNIISVILGNKTESLLVIEPLHGSLCHS